MSAGLKGPQHQICLRDGVDLNDISQQKGGMLGFRIGDCLSFKCWTEEGDCS